MIEFKNIYKSYSKTRYILSDVNMKIEKGMMVAIIGESGCGKTTLLKLINRLSRPSSGTILIGGNDIKSFDEAQLRRGIGYVIQQTGLFPHMTVRQNIELISKLQKKPKKEIEEKTIFLMDMIGLKKEYLDRYTSELSGGQQQRVGVARAFATDPEIILMDEPFSALDPITRSDLQDELVHIQSQFKKTIVFVTHDMNEAIKMADLVCIMKDGRILQYDTPENILKKPADDFVSSFVGKNRIWASPEFIKISDIMLDHPITATKNLSIFKCIEKMRMSKVDSLLITDKADHRFLGVLKASKIRSIEDKDQAVEKFMNTNFPVLSPDMCILDALKIVNEKHISALPVVHEDGRLAGLVTKSSLITTLSQQYFDYEEEGVL